MKSAFDIAEEYLKHAGESAPADPTEGQIVAVEICSAVLQAHVWFALRDDWKPAPGDSKLIFYASELPVVGEWSLMQNHETILMPGQRSVEQLA